MALNYLNLHPTSEVVSKKVGGHRIQHVNLIGLERHGLLIEIVPIKNKTGQFKVIMTLQKSLSLTKYI